MGVDTRYIDYAFMRSMMTSDEIGYKLENVKKVNARLDINVLIEI
jgi:hypothetical protein